MEKEVVIWYRNLPRTTTEIRGMKSFDNLSKTDFVFSSSEDFTGSDLLDGLVDLCC